MNQKDICAGAIFIVTALLYGAMTVRDLPIGSAMRMGPGYFPILLCSALAAFGVAIVIKGLRSPEVVKVEGLPIRPMAFLLSAPIFFAAMVETMGLFPTTLISVLLASCAMSQPRMIEAICASFIIASFSTLVFGKFLGLPIPAFGPLLRNFFS